MFCKNCGKEIKEGEKFCRECGTAVDGTAQPITPNSNGTVPMKKGLAIASLVLGICSFIFGWFLLPLPIIGLILGIVQKGKCGEKTTGIILNSIALGLIIIAYLLLGTALVSFTKYLVNECEGEDCINSIIEDDDNIIEDDTTSEILDRLRDWNLYKHLRQGNLAKNVELTGGWRYLGTAKEYFTFYNGEFYWYKDVDDREDNYYSGTYTIEKGADSMSSIGITQDKIDNFKSKFSTEVSDDNIYAITMTPTKLITGGVDKSSTNIPSGTVWRAVWIVVDHGTEGIEGQVYHLEDNQYAYYVKLED